MLLTFNLLAIAATCLGGFVPVARLSREGMWRMFALRAGILLSVTFTDILPEAWREGSSTAGWGALSAFTLFFVMENFQMMDSCPEYLEECSVHILGWAALAALFGHSFIDGFNLSVSFHAGTLAGFAVGLALSLHKLADGFTLTTLFRQSGYTRGQSLAGLCLVALATPLGSLASAFGIGGLPSGVSAALLGFAGGSFLYIGSADLLRRMHKVNDRASLLYFGVGMFGIAAVKSL